MADLQPQCARRALSCSSRAQEHHDAEEAVQRERQRFSCELRPASATVSKGDLVRGSVARTDSHGAGDERSDAAEGQGSSRVAAEAQRPIGIESWYTPAITFWTTHICPTIDEGAFRDHLGTHLSSPSSAPILHA